MWRKVKQRRGRTDVGKGQDASVIRCHLSRDLKTQEGSHTVLGTASSTETEVGVSEGGSGWITWGLSMRKKCNTSSKRVGGGPSAEPPWVWKSR